MKKLDINIKRAEVQVVYGNKIGFNFINCVKEDFEIISLVYIHPSLYLILITIGIIFFIYLPVGYYLIKKPANKSQVLLGRF